MTDCRRWFLIVRYCGRWGPYSRQEGPPFARGPKWRRQLAAMSVAAWGETLRRAGIFVDPHSTTKQAAARLHGQSRRDALPVVPHRIGALVCPWHAGNGRGQSPRDCRSRHGRGAGPRPRCLQHSVPGLRALFGRRRIRWRGLSCVGQRFRGWHRGAEGDRHSRTRARRFPRIGGEASGAEVSPAAVVEPSTRERAIDARGRAGTAQSNRLHRRERQ